MTYNIVCALKPGSEQVLSEFISLQYLIISRRSTVYSTAYGSYFISSLCAYFFSFFFYIFVWHGQYKYLQEWSRRG